MDVVHSNSTSHPLPIGPAVFKNLLPQNAPPSIDVTLSGMLMYVKESQPRNALSPIVLTPFGIIIDIKEEQNQNALFPIVLTLLGMVISVRGAGAGRRDGELVHCPKASCPIDFTPNEICTLFKDLQPSNAW